jgi:1-deoxy-D-xylulose-5-phosphate reductoisomerase
VVHGLVRTVDGSLIAQMGVTDMRLPILYALTYPKRVSAPLPALDLTSCGNLSFHPPDWERFPCLKLAYQALREGGTMPAILNAANEVAVDAFLQEEIPFTAIPKVVERTMGTHASGPVQDLDQILDVDAKARLLARQFSLEHAF